MPILELLKQRRIWTGLFAFIAFMLPLCGVHMDLDVANLTDAVMKVIEAVCSLMAIVLPIISYYKPKQAEIVGRSNQ